MLLAASFPPAPLGFLAWFAFVPLLVVLQRRLDAGSSLRATFALGYAFGFMFYLIGTSWIARLSNVAITVPWLKYPAWIAAAAYLALFAGLATVLTAWLVRRSGLSLTVCFPVAYLLAEELRASGELGFPWFQPGYTQHAYPPLIQIASLGSVTLVTLWILVVNVLLWRAFGGGARVGAAAIVKQRTSTPRLRPLAMAGAALAVLLPWFWGSHALRAAPKHTGIPVALVQGNIPGAIKWAGTHQQAILDTFLRLTAQATDTSPKPGIVIWPETATGSYLRRQLDQTLAVVGLAARTGVPIFTGYADYRLDSLGRVLNQNAAGAFAPDGATEPSYAKRHLVPFGERMPFQRLMPALGRIELGQAEWTAGQGPVLFPSALGPFACLICFESIFPSLARADVHAGARWLVNITNDEWFGDSPALYQHAAMAVFRAVENHVPLARCANTGLTLLVDANGRIVERLPVFRTAVLIAPLPAPGIPTAYARLGDWPGVLALVAGLALAAGVTRGARR
ncbi:MAG TPA: apolipoprotein N-acyltransferase [Candidatus Limnocylindria bacterium]|nr:apolipoprotein N-acyltransferase [Candidatus Limnocylindria bacterium]